MSSQLEEPLLGADTLRQDELPEPSASSSMAKSGAEGSRRQGGGHEWGSKALVPYSINRMNWEELWRVLWANCCSSWAGILGAQGPLFVSIA